jgi:hypothetical protein
VRNLKIAVAVVVSIAIFIFLISRKPEVYKVTEINDTPAHVMQDDPNLAILSKEKQNCKYRFVIVCDNIDEVKYWKRYGKHDAIVTTSDYSGFDGKGKKSVIFSDQRPDQEFFDVKESK